MSDEPTAVESPDPYYDKVKAMIDKAAVELTEYVDSVIIIATAQHESTPTKSRMWARGRGNYYAQLGSVKEWLTRQDEATRQEVFEIRNVPGDDIP